jgi:RNA ligase (TIGR02306 family)
VNNEQQGVCSRNLELKEDQENSWWKLAQKHDIINKIKQTGRNLAIQGEIYGSSINGNLYKLNDQRFMVYDIYDIDNQKYLLPDERWKLVEQLGLPHVPLVGFGVLVGAPSDLLEDAEGKSTVNPDSIREGYVFKSMTDSSVSFKVVSNQYLLKHE